MSSVAAIVGVGFLIGLRHAFEPDHLAAVSTLATRQGRLRDAARLGFAWGAGHTVSIGIVALVVVALGLEPPEAFAGFAELLVAFLLIALGGAVLVRYARGRWHLHRHSHDGTVHLHLHSHRTDSSHRHHHATWDVRRALGLGLVHGMAGSAAVLVLVVATAPTAADQASYIAAFGVGTILGMLLVSLALGYLVRAASRKGTTLATVLHLASAGASFACGLILAVEVLSGWSRVSPG